MRPERWNSDLASYDAQLEVQLKAEFEPLWAEVDAIWERSQIADGFHAFVSADYPLVLNSLIRLRGQAATFLEWGSGMGVVTIMASRLGFEAFGIENEPELIEIAERFAAQYAPAAKFYRGSFFPTEFEWHPSKGDIESRTTLHSHPAYEDMDRELSDFDLVYAYPWPEEHRLYRNVMREFGRSNALFLTYDVREGMDLQRCGKKRSSAKRRR